MIHEELSRGIIGAAMVILNELKPGLDEKLYERATMTELKHRGHRISVQAAFPVSFVQLFVQSRFQLVEHHHRSADYFMA